MHMESTALRANPASGITGSMFTPSVWVDVTVLLLATTVINFAVLRVDPGGTSTVGTFKF